MLKKITDLWPNLLRTTQNEEANNNNQQRDSDEEELLQRHGESSSQDQGISVDRYDILERLDNTYWTRLICVS